MIKQLARPTSDEEAEAFVANSDLTEYDLSGMRMVRFKCQLDSEAGQFALAANAAGPREDLGRSGGRYVSALHLVGA